MNGELEHQEIIVFVWNEQPLEYSLAFNGKAE